MNKILKNISWSLIVVLVIITTGGFIARFLILNNNEDLNKLTLISTSLVNTKTLLEDKNNTDLSKEIVEIETSEINTEEVKNNNSNNNQEVVENGINEEETITRNSEESKTVANQTEASEKLETTVKGNYSPNLEVAATISPIATYVGKITGYGPDCVGCTSGKTASGQYVMDGNIYYNDSTFGNIRIVAADSTIPFGSIIKITGLSIYDEPILAIVLDRGGMIGFSSNKDSYFDLLFETESAAMVVGRQTVTFELLRSGY